MTSTTLPNTRRFRPDIEGMRAVAVLVVILYHLGVPGFAGGYVGVDVFFVLSGFLITGLIADELDRTGTIALGTFIRRRMRRLLPASALVLVVTLAIAWYALPPLQLAELRTQAVATAAYGANIELALSGTDYLQSHAPPSALQHYWSLAVEEQFYLLWPLLLLLVTRRARRRGRSLARPMLVATIAVTVASLLVGVLWTRSVQPYAYFLLPARAWEMASGGVLILTLRRLGSPSRQLAEVAGWVGLALVVASVAMFDAATAFPGWAALLPVTGTCLLLAAGAREGRLQRTLSLRPMQAIGRRSYALYLWHWPLFVFADAIPGGRASLETRIALLVLTFVLAWATFRLVEDPLRHHAWLTRQPRATYGAGIAVTAVLVGVALVVTSPRSLDAPPLTASDAADTGTADSEVAAASTGLGVRSLSEPGGSAGTPEPPPGPFRPGLAEVRDDTPLVARDDCHRNKRDTSVDGCLYGSTDHDAPLVVLFGDSHAAQWFPALEWLAEDRGWRLLSLTKSACPSFKIDNYDGPSGRYPECDRWRANAIDRIVSEEPALVLVTSMITGHNEASQAERLDGLDTTVRALGGHERIVVLGDTPHLPTDPPVCLSDHLDDLTACDAARDEAAPLAIHERVGAVAEGAGGSFVETQSMVCPDERCRVVKDGILVYRDPHHLTATFARQLAPELGLRIERTVGGRGEQSWDGAATAMRSRNR
jgi:peptidoglycan/LPS O-acetylase OafA/YrhL